MIEWLRPGWLLALPAGLALLAWWWRVRAGAGPWRRQVDAELLAHLAGRAPAWSGRLALGAAGMTLILVCAALAGPTWRAQPAPLYRDLSARIVVLDLSPSMDAVDVVPSRLERARAAIVTLLREAADAQVGLVVFGADAFTVAPLMNDPSALVHLLASLGTGTLPRAGSRPDLGLEMARMLLERAGVVAGDVVLVGDSAGDERTRAAARRLLGAGFPLSVLGVGTPHGGPVRLASGAFAKSEGGDILVAQPEFAALERVAQAGGGRFHLLGAETPRFARGAQAWAASPAASAAESQLRQDDGVWFVLLALPFAALLFRRGWLAGLAAFALTLPPGQAQAFEWRDLWRRADQQAAAEFAKGRFGEHERLLQKLGPQSPWRALLLYRSGRFAQAAVLLAAGDTADAHYNRGNAHALEGRLEAALAAYGAALERSPSMRDALFNRALVREALARRRAEAQRGGEAERRSTAPAAGAPRESGLARRGAQPQAAPGDARSGPGAAREQAGAGTDLAQLRGQQQNAAQPEDTPDAAELKRLEGLLAAVPDDPGSLLANRFARQLRLRGSWHHDTGGRW
jgi:Ca-activated chloride channel family protein